MLQAMNWTLHFLEAEGSLAAWRDCLTAEARTVHDRIAEHLAPDVAMPPIDVVIQRVKGWGIPELGIGGNTPRRGCMTITLDPDNRHFPVSLEAGAFTRMLAHEFHHCLRVAAIGWAATLAYALVSEGLADHFDREMNGGDGQIWDHALHAPQWPWVLRQAEDALPAPGYDHARWFFGEAAGQPDGIPRWAGYTIGYRLVGAYLDAHPGARPSRLAATPASVIMEDAWPRLCEQVGVMPQRPQ